MKKYLQTVLILFYFSGISFIATAQQTLTAANYNPVIGDQFSSKNCSFISPGAGGANGTWNFAAAVPQSNNQNTVYVARSGAPNSSGFPNANMASKNSTNSTVDYYSYLETTPTGTRNHGLLNLGQNQTTTYTNPMDFVLPMSFNDVKTDTYSGYYSGSPTYTVSGTITYTYDGYGTVITPKGTFTNVIRIKSVDNNLTVGPNYSSSATITSYQFYQPGIHAPIATMSTISTPFISQNYGSYLNSGITGGSEEFAQSISLNLHPNPTTDLATLEYQFKTSEEVKISLTNIIGQEVNVLKEGKEYAGAQKYHFSVANLPKGIYFVRIAAGERIATKRLLVQ